MGHYVHQMPGCIGVLSRTFRCRSEKTRAAQRRLRTLAGARQKRLDPHAGSISVHTDSARRGQSALFATLAQSGRAGATSRRDEDVCRQGGLFARALAGAVVNRAVERSARPPAGALP